MVNRACLWQMEQKIMAVCGNLKMFMVDGTRYNGCIWEIVDVCD